MRKNLFDRVGDRESGRRRVALLEDAILHIINGLSGDGPISGKRLSHHEEDLSRSTT